MIRGDFQELERVSRIIDHITGTCEAPAAIPLPEYKTAFSLLLGLSYTIHMAQEGRCELYSAPNGIREDWIAPSGTPAELIAGEHIFTEQNKLVDEIEDIIVAADSPDLETFYLMDESGQKKALASLGVSSEKTDLFLQAIKPVNLYCFSHEKYPDITFHNTRLQFQVPRTEAALYAFLLRELFSQKETLLQKMTEFACKLPEDIREDQLSYCLTEARTDLTLLELLMEQLFSSLYPASVHKTLSGAELSTDLTCVTELSPDSTYATELSPDSTYATELSPDSTSGTAGASDAISSADLLSALRFCEEIREKKAPKDFLKNWDGEKLFKVSDLLKKHYEDSPEGLCSFINELMKL